MAKLTPKKTAKGKPASPPAQTRKVAPVKPAAKAVVRPGKVNRRVPARTPVRSGSKMPKPSAAQPVKPVLPTPVNNTGKPVKNQAGLKARDLAFFRDLLIAKRRELIGDVHSMEQEALQNSNGTNLSNLPLHMADMGTDNYEQEFTLGLVEKDRNLLREINVALIKIRDGNYGICEGTGKPISRARLEAQPWARYSIEFARQREKKLMGKH